MFLFVFLFFHILNTAVVSTATAAIIQMSKIQNIHGRMIFDSRGNPTVEVDVTTEK